MRIAIGGFLHESHSFAPMPTTYQDFVEPAGWSGLVTGARVIEALHDKSMPIAGAIAEARKQPAVKLVPLAWCFAYPAGPVTDEAFERIAGLLCAGLSNALDAGPLDGVYLDLHGAAATPTFPDMEGELLRRVRTIIGLTPLTISVDPHANLTRAMVDHADAIAPFRTYPHVDFVAAGARAFDLLLRRIARGKPWARSYQQLDFLIPITSQCTLMAPMAPVMTTREKIEKSSAAVELAWCFGFPYVDFAGCGPAVAAYAETQSAADAAVAQFATHVSDRERTFALDATPAKAAVAEAIRVSNSARKPVVIADTQDNPGGGGHGDTTGLLAELIAQNARGAVVGLINDAESAAACHAAGASKSIKLSLGGKSDGKPLNVTAHIEKLTDGRYVCTGPMMRGNPCDHGLSALIEISGVRVIVVSKKTQAYDQALFRHVGIEPQDAKILVLKSSVHFRADFEPIAEKVIVGLSPGPVAVDPRSFPFKHLRPGLRLLPRTT